MRTIILASLIVTIVAVGAVPAQDSREGTPREKAVAAALDWLQRHQAPDGSWSCASFPKSCDAQRGAPCTGRGAAAFDVGVTGLALLAFVEGGFDGMRPSAYRDCVRNGLKYLKSVQDADGCFGPMNDNRHTYSHACATMAMCAGYAASKQLPWRKSAEMAVAYIYECQNPYKAWRYGRRPGDNDSSVTGWMLAALASAQRAGVPVDEKRVSSGIAFLDSITDEDTGRTGYIKKGERSVRPEGLQGKFPAQESEALTAIAMSARIFFDATDTSLMIAGRDLLAKKLPMWDEAKGSIDFDYWYWGTIAMSHGGPHRTRWIQSLMDQVIPHQVKTGCAEGSWDPKDPWSDEGGRVYSTAMMALSLEAESRYPARKPSGRVIEAFRDEASRQVWDAEKRRKDPLGFVEDASMRLREQLTNLGQLAAALVIARDGLDEPKQRTLDGKTVVVFQLEALKEAYGSANTEKRWPVSILGRTYGEQDLQQRVDVLLVQRSVFESVLAQFEETNTALTARSTAAKNAVDETKGMLVILRVQREVLRESALDAPAEKLLTEASEIMTRNESQLAPARVPTVDEVMSLSKLRLKPAPAALDFLKADSKPESRR